MHTPVIPARGLAAVLPLAGLWLAGTLTAQAPAARSRLHLEEVVADTASFNVVSTLIVGPTEVVLFDAQNRMSDGRRVAERIAATGRHLTAIFLSHPDEDHFFGALAVLDRFPGTPIYMAPAGLEEFHRVAEGYRTRLKPRMGPEAPDSLIRPVALPPAGLAVDGERLEVLPDLQGDVLTPANSAIWIPSLGALLAGDIVFNGVYPYLAASTKASREAWGQSLDRLAALQPTILVAGHKASPDLPDAPASLQFMRSYLDDFEAARVGSPNVQAMVNTLRGKYPDLHVAMLLGYSASMTFGK